MEKCVDVLVCGFWVVVSRVLASTGRYGCSCRFHTRARECVQPRAKTFTDIDLPRDFSLLSTLNFHLIWEAGVGFTTGTACSCGERGAVRVTSAAAGSLMAAAASSPVESSCGAWSR